MSIMPAQGWGDTLYLKNGNVVEGIIVGEDDSGLTVRVDSSATMLFTKDEIASVERDTSHSTDIQNEWDEIERMRQQVEEERLAFEEKQRKAGLVEYKGEWMSPEDRDELQQIDASREAKKYIWGRTYSTKRKRLPSSRRRSSRAQDLLKSKSWNYRETVNFRVFFDNGNLGKAVTEKAEYLLEKIRYDLSLDKELAWKGKCEIFIIPTETLWSEFISDLEAPPEAIGGFVPADAEEIFLWGASESFVRITFAHELTHMVFREFSRGKKSPLWLEEGLAQYESGLLNTMGEMIVAHMRHGSHIVLEELVASTEYPEDLEQRNLFYAESAQLVEFFITQYGRDRFCQFARELLGMKDFERAMRVVYGHEFSTIKVLRRAWINYILA